MIYYSQYFYFILNYFKTSTVCTICIIMLLSLIIVYNKSMFLVCISNLYRCKHT